MTRAEIEAVAERVRESGLSVSDGDVSLAMLDIDVAGIRAAAASRVEWQLWDQTSPINDVAAADIFSLRNDVSGADQIYLVLIDGKVTHFQPHAPSVAGVEPMTAETVGTFAAGHVADIVDHVALTLLVDAVRKKILTGSG